MFLFHLLLTQFFYPVLTRNISAGVKTVDYAGWVATLIVELHECLLLDAAATDAVATEEIEGRIEKVRLDQLVLLRFTA